LRLTLAAMTWRIQGPELRGIMLQPVSTSRETNSAVP
jgi:hypothetical protein